MVEALYQSRRAHQCGEPGLFADPKLTGSSKVDGFPKLTGSHCTRACSGNLRTICFLLTGSRSLARKTSTGSRLFRNQQAVDSLLPVDGFAPHAQETTEYEPFKCVCV